MGTGRQMQNLPTQHGHWPPDAERLAADSLEELPIINLQQQPKP
jgi:hypothetical protein